LLKTWPDQINRIYRSVDQVPEDPGLNGFQGNPKSGRNLLAISNRSKGPFEKIGFQIKLALECWYREE
jgi:hypothetical protein